jgi:hypothetical protein
MAKLQKDTGAGHRRRRHRRGNVLHDSMAESTAAQKWACASCYRVSAPGCDIDDRRLYLLYERPAHDMILFLQTSGRKRQEHRLRHPRHRPVAEDFPNLRIIAGHACYP